MICLMVHNQRGNDKDIYDYLKRAKTRYSFPTTTKAYEALFTQVCFICALVSYVLSGLRTQETCVTCLCSLQEPTCEMHPVGVRCSSALR